MLVYTLWRKDSDDMAWLVKAIDEYTVDECGWPALYVQERDKPHTRELVVRVKNKDISALFESPVVDGEVVVPVPDVSNA